MPRHLARLALAAATAVLAIALAAPASAQRTKVTVYTALEPDQLAQFKTALEADVPSVEVSWVRDSTGVITARFLKDLLPFLKPVQVAATREFLIAAGLILVLHFRPQGLIPERLPRSRLNEKAT